MEQRIYITMQMRLLQEVRQYNSEFGCQTFEALLTIGLNPDMGVTELADKLDMTMASASRNVQYLSAWRKVGDEGYGLVEVAYDLYDRRRKLLRLTDEGKKLVAKLTQIASSCTEKRHAD